MLLGVGKGQFVQAGLGFRHVSAEIDNPHVALAARDVEAVEPRFDDFAVRATVRVRLAEPASPKFAGQVEGAGFLNAEIGGVGIFRQRLGFGEVHANGSGQIGMNFCNLNAIQPIATVNRKNRPKSNQRNAHGGAVVDPFFVAPRFEYARRCHDAFEHFAVGATTDGVG